MPESTTFLQGSYVYLLITQVVLVTGLMLAALWLIVRRLKTQQEGMLAGPGPQTLTQVPVVDPELEDLARRQTEKISTLEAELANLERSTTELKEGSEKTTKLREKIRYLEQKLLEYEILQEEISTLSHLKQENERLKSQLADAGLQPEVDESVAGNEEVAPSEVKFVDPLPEDEVSRDEAPDASEGGTLELTPSETVASETPSDESADEASSVPPVAFVDGGSPPAKEEASETPSSGRSEDNPFLKAGDTDDVVRAIESEGQPTKVGDDLKKAGSDQEVEFILSQLDELDKK